MNRQILIILMLAAGSLSVVGADQTGPQPSQPEAAKTQLATNGFPKIQFDKMVYDFGSTSLVQQLAGTFIISNAGDATLTIGKPTTSCGCTIAALKNATLAPGEKTELGFTMAVGNIPRGHAEKAISVPSNDTNLPVARLVVKADIVPVFDYAPQTLDVGNLHLSTTTNLVIQIKRTDGKPLGLTAVETKAPFIHPRLEPVEGTTNAATLRVEVVADANARRFNELLNVVAEAGGRPLLTIPIGGQIVGDIVIKPSQLVWGIPDPDNFPGPQGPAAATRIVTLSPGSSDQPLVVSNLSCSLPELKVTLAPTEDGKAFKITAVIDKVPKETVNGGKIRVETNLQRQPVVEIPFSINVFRHN